ncbi:uncharacterized protein C18orf63-like [Carassius carassius]|uniref:uncharacterized protein C18orf63-like n=1 Tax=Carassius carassius TaxID=217509 RepID=UPI0028695B2F|nr:uncharacterized protein C18orf63-like [Carassius carassius]
MSGSGTQSLFVLNLPELRDLCCINLFFPNNFDEGEMRDKQVQAFQPLLEGHVFSFSLTHAHVCTLVYSFTVLERSLTETQLCVSVEANTVRLPPAVVRIQTPPACVHNLHSYTSGYQLPSVREEEEVIYCSVYFKPIGDKLFTYPLCCIHTQPVQCIPRVDLQGVLGPFISDLQAGPESFHVQMSCKPCYYSNELKTPDTQGHILE